MDLYFKFKLFFEFMLPFSIIALIVLIVIIAFIISCIQRRTHKNCFDCEYYNLYDVSSYGGHCKLKCDKTNRIDSHEFNDSTHFIKCNLFKNKENKNGKD